MKKNKSIILDIDDTLSDFIGNLLYVHNNMFETCYDRGVFSNWQMPADLYLTFKKYEKELYITQPVLPKVLKKLNKFKKQGYKIILMTARDESFRAATIFNLAYNKIPYDMLFFNKNKSVKTSKLMKQLNVIAFADDKLETVNSIAERTNIKNIFIITRAYNRGQKLHKRVKRIYSIDEIKI